MSLDISIVIYAKCFVLLFRLIIAAELLKLNSVIAIAAMPLLAVLLLPNIACFVVGPQPDWH